MEHGIGFGKLELKRESALGYKQTFNTNINYVRFPHESGHWKMVRVLLNPVSSFVPVGPPDHDPASCHLSTCPLFGGTRKKDVEPKWGASYEPIY